VENKDNPHLKLAEMGAETWNRWARTLMDDEAIDALNVSDEKKTELKFISPLNSGEQVELAEKLGLSSLYEFERGVDFKELEIGRDFSGFWFPLHVSFEKATFSEYADFSEAIFNERADFSEVTFSDGGGFSEATFSGVADFSKAIFNEHVKGMFAQVKSILSGTADFNKSVFHGPAYLGKTTFNGSTDFREAIFNERADFNEAIFSGYASFGEVIFSEHVEFIEVTFSGGASFREVIFGCAVHFSKAKFNGDLFESSKSANFSEAKFNGYAIFSEAAFGKKVDFINVSFKGPVNFKKTKFNIPPKFHNADLHQDTSFHNAIYVKKTGNEDDARAWRTLKLAMNKIHNHDQELMFFKYEMDAKRAVLRKSGKLFSAWLPVSLYKWSSNYGTSLLKTFSLWVGLWIISALLYGFIWFDGCSISFSLSSYKNCITGFQFSSANLLPFVPSSKSIMGAILKAKEIEMGFWFQSLTIAQNLISTILLFLIGLALKHKFSIK